MILILRDLIPPVQKGGDILGRWPSWQSSGLIQVKTGSSKLSVVLKSGSDKTFANLHPVQFLLY